MDFLDGLGRAISDTGRAAMGRMRDISGVIQLKSRLNAEKEKVSRAYISLGRYYYEHMTEEELGAHAPEVRAIRDGLNAQAELEKQIEEMEGVRVCPACGAKVLRESRFCSRCGAPMERAEEKAEEKAEAEKQAFAEEAPEEEMGEKE